ncbi:MAG TPA: ImmA/IrrE family metallo-endopeptidase [Thermoleophilia bacterium]|nr:ImmA/IrrE family metallo-endopeptidase [Thermoleophilia bacterium]
MNNAHEVIRRTAEQLLKAAGVTRPPVPLRAVVSFLNLSLVEKACDPFCSEAALVPLGDGHAIELRGRGRTNERRLRFTIAHEIGHFMLHQGRAVNERAGARSEGTARYEREADQFAAELLMPEHLVRQAALEVGADPRLLADRFDVSVQAMSVRLRRLGLAERQSDLLPPSRDL